MIELSIILVMFHGFYDFDRKNIKEGIRFVVVGSLLVAVIGNMVRNNVVSHLMCTLSTYLLFLLYSKKTGKIDIMSRTVLFFLVMFALFMVQYAGVNIYMILKPDFEYTFIEGVISQGIALVISLAIVWILPLKSLNQFIEGKNAYFSFSVINLFLVFYFLSIFWHMDFAVVIESIIEIMLMIVITLFINIVFARESLLNKDFKKQIEVNERYKPIVQNIIDKFRETQHDYKSRLNALSTYVDNLPGEHSNPLKDHIVEASNKEMWTELIQIGNEMVMAVLYSKYAEAINKGIKVDFSINLPFFKSDYKDFELIDMYGILMDNAIEAAEKVQSDRRIIISINRKGKLYNLTVRNISAYLSDEEIGKLTKKGYTSKNESGHGVGLHKLDRMLKKKKGNMHLSYDASSEMFVAEISHS
jgi:two-component system sensor histidine kinase AgrC